MTLVNRVVEEVVVEHLRQQDIVDASHNRGYEVCRLENAARPCISDTSPKAADISDLAQTTNLGQSSGMRTWNRLVAWPKACRENAHLGGTGCEASATIWARNIATTYQFLCSSCGNQPIDQTLKSLDFE